VPSRSLLVLAVVAATITAGCAAFGGSFAAGEGETLTPVRVSSPTSTPPSVPSPTDLSGDDDSDPASDGGLSDIGIVARHSAALNDSSFRLRTEQRIVVDGSPVQRSTFERTVAPGGTAYVATLSRTRNEYPRNLTISNVDAYYNGSVAATRYRTIDGSRVRYTFRRDPAVQTDALAAQTQLTEFLRAYDVRRRGDTSGTPGTVLHANRLASPAAIPNPIGTSDPRNGRLSMTVRHDGVVTATTIEYTVTVGENRTGRVVRTIRITDVGSVVVERPPWVETAARAREA